MLLWEAETLHGTRDQKAAAGARVEDLNDAELLGLFYDPNRKQLPSETSEYIREAISDALLVILCCLDFA